MIVVPMSVPSESDPPSPVVFVGGVECSPNIEYSDALVTKVNQSRSAGMYVLNLSYLDESFHCVVSLLAWSDLASNGDQDC